MTNENAMAIIEGWSGYKGTALLDEGYGGLVNIVADSLQRERNAALEEAANEVERVGINFWNMRNGMIAVHETAVAIRALKAGVA